MNNKEKIEESSYWQKKKEKSILEYAKSIKNDYDKDNRLNELLCKICYYKEGVVAGQAITKKDCDFCKTEVIYSTTYTDKICPNCAKKNQCCKHCLSKL